MLNYSGLGLGILFQAKDMATGIMRKVEMQLDGVTNASRRAQTTWRSALGDLRTGIAMMGAGAAVLAPLYKIGKASYETSAFFRKTTQQYAVMLKDANKATQFIGELQRFAEQTPFDFLELTDYGRQLMAYQFRVEEIIPLMQDLGNAQAALQAPQGLERMIRAFGQIQAKGKLAGEEIRQLAELGIPVYAILEKQLGLTRDQLDKTASLKIPVEQVLGALRAGLREQYPDMMGELMKYPEGITANIGDMLTRIRKGIGDQLYDGVVSMLQSTLRTVTRFGQEAITTALGKGLANVFGAIKPLIDGVLALARGIADFAAKRPFLIQFITTTLGLAAALAVVAGTFKTVNALGRLLPVLFAKIGMAGSASMTAILGPIALVGAAMAGLRVAMDKDVGGIGTAWNSLVAMVQGTRLDPERGWITEIPAEMGEALQKSGWMPFVTDVWMGLLRIRSAWDGFKAGFAEFGAKVRDALSPILEALDGIGRAFLAPFQGLAQDAATKAAAGTFDEWRTKGERLGSAMSALGGLIKGIIQPIAMEIKNLQPLFAGIARVLGGLIKGAGEFISKILNKLGGGDSAKAAERLEQIGAVVGRLLIAFLALKAGGAVFKTLTGGMDKLADAVLNGGAALDGLGTAMTNAKSLGTVLKDGLGGVFKSLGFDVGKLKNATSNLKDAWDLTKDAAISFGKSLWGTVIGALKAAWAGFMSAASAAWAFVAPILANPITWVVLGIVAATILLWKNWDKVKEIVKNTWETFKDFLTRLVVNVDIAIIKIKLFFAKGIQHIVDLMAKLPGPLGAPWKAAKAGLDASIAEMEGRVLDLDGMLGDLDKRRAERAAAAAAKHAEHEPALAKAYAGRTRGIAGPPAPAIMADRITGIAGPPTAAPTPATPQITVTPVVKPSPAATMPGRQPPPAAGGASAEAIAAQLQNQPIHITTEDHISVNVDGQKVAEAVHKVEREDEARRGRWR